jgi:tRNA dimethylallyltransferase
MVEAGALAEAGSLAAMGLPAETPALKALGARELIGHLAGECGLEAAVAAAQQATRRYAKRQMTWFRHQAKDANFISLDRLDPTSMERKLPDIFSYIRNHG